MGGTHTFACRVQTTCPSHTGPFPRGTSGTSSPAPLLHRREPAQHPLGFSNIDRIFFREAARSPHLSNIASFSAAEPWMSRIKVIAMLLRSGSFRFRNIATYLNLTATPLAIARLSDASDQPDHLEIVNFTRTDFFKVWFAKNGVLYMSAPQPTKRRSPARRG
jgi:hypothetical protein